jgi:RNA polymerase sigma-32 factor
MDKGVHHGVSYKLKVLGEIGTTQAQRKILYNLDKEKRRLESLGISPSSALLASRMGVKEEEVEEVSLRLSHSDLSLDAPLHEKGEDTVMDTIESGEDVEEIASNHEKTETLSRKIKDFKDSLNDRDSFIFDRRILAEEPEALDRIGARFNISRERVRQLEAGIMNMFRASLEKDRAALGY